MSAKSNVVTSRRASPYVSSNNSMYFDRGFAGLRGVNHLYGASAGLKPGRYRVVSAAVATGALCGPLVVGYVVAYRGRLVRAWLS